MIFNSISEVAAHWTMRLEPALAIPPRLDGSGLSAVVSLAEKAALSGYLERTLDLRSSLSSERSVLHHRLRRIGNASEGAPSANISEEFVQIAVGKYQGVLVAYRSLIEVARGYAGQTDPTYFSRLRNPQESG
jgi:hypothetical protein